MFLFRFLIFLFFLFPSFSLASNQVCRPFFSFPKNKVSAVYAMKAMQNNLVIVGSEGKQNLKNTFLMQLNSKGEIDSRFGKEGLHFSFGSDEEIHGLGLDHTGFVMAGFFKNHTRDFLFVKINSDGNLNSTFGKNIFSGQNKKGELHYIDQNDSGWLAAGFSHKLGKSDFSLVRINAEGGPDLNFGYQGVVTLKHGSKDHLYGVTTLSDGTIAATGSALNKGKENCVVVRLSKKGELLSSFGVGGFVFLPSQGQGMCAAVKEDNQHRLIVVGFSETAKRNTDFFIARLGLNGELDSSFGHGGIVLENIAGIDSAHDFFIHPDGSLDVAGEYQDARLKKYGFVLLRLDSEGKPQSSFGKNFIITCPLAGPSFVNTLVETENGIYLGGVSQNLGVVYSISP
ncbi:MAG: hypothetical protein A3G32_00505 [Deltaproteobacteria bacterium RIFCSPLOWO2_12_FULL_40_28]|nr:MAG: hypothetical protein A3C45_04515 [Deltaproteobacteria bacterium RIFCSPHIGHO2_02_FULL_40_28]OGQ21144.1 MAG: hypothetical protein A3E27_05275 [Deltaproteobacteria bacterium RIFCSPHIGHO2_12_FULL_40_32]OGQ39130.1 MAG: hypothetical protein A3I69_05810 [Deltaproteobacteria bacterium RIFCSPLOWO2_02_FULL_40_36]OGQ53200.1 MAG: hypothetical protein A3G32_00505 [Deltaproteobacteria bacterium RIFCSPLOWO2_12_FULL_40_28]